MIPAETIEHAKAIEAELRRQGRDAQAEAIASLIRERSGSTADVRGGATRTNNGASEASPPIWEEILRLAATVPPEESEKLPPDLAEQPDHYLYGAPRRR